MKSLSGLSLLLAFLVVWVSSAKADDLVTLSYTDTSVIIDYSGLVNSGVSVKSIRYYQCEGEITNVNKTISCRNFGVKSATPRADHKFEITQTGLFGVELIQGAEKPMGSQIQVVRAWHQFIANLDNPDNSLRAAIRNHSPVYSFFGDEEYFPVPIGAIYNRPLTNYSVSAAYPNIGTVLSRFGVNGNATVLEYMKGNGHVRSHLKLNSTTAKAIKSDENDFPVYWYADQVSGDKARVTYFTLHSYDEKKYLSDSLEDLAELAELLPGVEDLGDHAIDRESIAITFNKTGESWEPQDVTYAAHLPSQTMQFLGCSDGESCENSTKGNEITSWNNGATTLDWEKVSRDNNHPIVYVAHGSHGHFPARGFYNVVKKIRLTDGVSKDAVIVDGEPAGELKEVNEDFKTPNLVELDLSRADHAALTFSGTVITGLAENYRQFPFVRYPTENWVASLNRKFQTCVDNDLKSCRDYMRIELATCYGIGSLKSAVALADVDSDLDGVDDTRDHFPNDTNETTDLDNNGIGDNASPPNGFSTLSGIVRDTSDSPVAAAYVRLDMQQSDTGRAVALQTQTDTNGYYQLPIDLDNLPDTFAMSVITDKTLSQVALFKKESINSADFNQDIKLADCEREIVQVEGFPRLHHIGNDFFEGQTNSQFQRETEGQVFSLGFKLPDHLFTYTGFRVNFLIKGVDGSSSTFNFNNGNSIIIPGAVDNGNFFNVTYEGVVSEHLNIGQNEMTISAGYSAATQDFDDFEFANAVITLF